jgi:hypothetical protein
MERRWLRSVSFRAQAPMKSWFEDRIPLTLNAAIEAAFMSVAGTAIAFAILACIIWLVT